MFLNPADVAERHLLRWVFGLVLLFGAAALASGIWVGVEWARGRQAIDQKAELQKQVSELASAAKLLQQQSVTATNNYRRATQRLNHIADMQERDREEQRQFDHQQRQTLEAILTRRPDLRTGHAGADVLQHWNRSNAGSGAAAATATARHAGSPDAGVPGSGASGKRPVENPAGQPRPGRQPVPPVQGQQKPVDPGHAGLAGDRVGLVLRFSPGHAGARGRLHA